MAAPEPLEFAESDPQVLAAHPEPESVQLTPLFCESFCTVAVKLFVPAPAWMEAEFGETVTTMAAEPVSVIVATTDFVLSATEVAVSMTVAGV
jgi:hypothetical protein